MNKYPISLIRLMFDTQKKINIEMSKKIQYLYRQRQYKIDNYGFMSIKII